MDIQYIFRFDVCSSPVYAVEASEIADQAKLVIRTNGMQDRITVMHDKVEVVPEYSFKYLSLLTAIIFDLLKWPAVIPYRKSFELTCG